MGMPYTLHNHLVLKERHKSRDIELILSAVSLKEHLDDLVASLAHSPKCTEKHRMIQNVHKRVQRKFPIKYTLNMSIVNSVSIVGPGLCDTCSLQNVSDEPGVG